MIAFALLAPITMLTAPQGAKLAHRLHAEKLRRYFAIFLSADTEPIKMIAAGSASLSENIGRKESERAENIGNAGAAA